MLRPRGGGLLPKLSSLTGSKKNADTASAEAVDTAAANDTALPIVNRDEVTIGPAIGTGSFKDVHEGQFRGSSVAVLKFRQESRWPREAAALGIIGKHEHITALVGSIDEPDGWIILAERAMHGALDLILERQPDSIHLRHTLAITHQITHALVAIEAAGFVHADVAARNVLVYELSDARCVVKLTDFGSATRVAASAAGVASRDHRRMAKKHVAARWAAPEVVRVSPPPWQGPHTVVLTRATSCAHSSLCARRRSPRVSRPRVTCGPSLSSRGSASSPACCPTPRSLTTTCSS